MKIKKSTHTPLQVSLLERNFLDIRNLDIIARQASWAHQLDARAKLITTLVFIIMVVSVDKYAIAQLIPFMIFPAVLIGMGNLPSRYLMKKICIVAPFAILLGIFNPVVDRTVMMYIGPFGITGGWVSFVSLLVRFGLTVATALILVALTGFNGICFALEQLRVPRVFVTQLLFLYRFLFVLLDEACRMLQARTLRTFDTKSPGMKTFISMLGYLLLKAANRAERIHLAMCCRGFDGTVRMLNQNGFDTKDAFFTVGWSCLFVLFRVYNIPQIIGTEVLGLLT